MKAWERLEREIAGQLNGRRTPGSGNKHIKGDVQAGTFLIEAKQRCGKEPDGIGYYLDLKSEWFIQLIKQARDQRREPVLVASVGRIRTYYCFRESYLSDEGLLDGTDLPDIVTAGKQFRLHSRHDNAYLRILFVGMDEPLVLVPDYEITHQIAADPQKKPKARLNGGGSFSKTKRKWTRSPEEKARAASERKRRYQAYRNGCNNTD